jgi:hypothetical protein
MALLMNLETKKRKVRSDENRRVKNQWRLKINIWMRYDYFCMMQNQHLSVIASAPHLDGRVKGRARRLPFPTPPPVARGGKVEGRDGAGDVADAAAASDDRP